MKQKIKVTDRSKLQSVRVYNYHLHKNDIKELFNLLCAYSELEAGSDYNLINDSQMIMLDLQRIYMKRYNEYLDGES